MSRTQARARLSRTPVLRVSGSHAARPSHSPIRRKGVSAFVLAGSLLAFGLGGALAQSAGGGSSGGSGGSAGSTGSSSAGSTGSGSTGSTGSGASGSVGGSAAGGVGATGSPAGAGASGSGSGSGSVSAPAFVSPTLGTTAGSDISGSGTAGEGATGAANGVGSANTTTDTLGTQSIEPATVDSVARSGNAGAMTGLSRGSGGSNEVEQPASPSLRSGSGSPPEYEIRQPGVGVDLQSIRGALSADPSATPKPNGD